MTSFVSENPVKLLSLENAFPKSPIGTDSLIEALGQHCNDPTLQRRARAIAHRLGIKERYLSRDISSARGRVLDDCDAPSLCHHAFTKALTSANRQIENVEYLIGHTTSPHTLLPPNIAWVADSANYAAPYMELRQACTGFANALQIGSAMISANQLSCVGIIGSEVGSPYFTASEDFADIEQLINYVQMGDGATAALIGPPDGTGRSQITDLFVGHIGNGREPGLALHGGGSSNPYCEQGLPVFAHRAESVREHGPKLFAKGVSVIEQRGYRLENFRFIIPHQANGRMSKPLAKYLKVDEQSIYSTAQKFGNLGSAAIWAALGDLLAQNLLAPGEQVLVLGAEATKYMYGGFVYTH